MHTIDWDDIRHFIEVVQSGSATQAATRLGVNHSTVYRRISSLESRLGKSLFERSNNKWVITPLGERIIAYAKSMAEEANNIERQVMADSVELSGPLRITAADHCIEKLIAPVMSKFIKCYPDINLEVIASADELNLAAREADIALRGTNEPPQNIVGKRVAQIAYNIYGTKELLNRVRSNPFADDIPCITWIGDGQSRPQWIDRDFPNSRYIYRASSMSAMLSMARENMGVAQLACVLGDSDPLLHRIPSSYVEPGTSLWVLSHVDLRTTARVRIFRDFIVDELLLQKDLIEGRHKLSSACLA